MKVGPAGARRKALRPWRFGGKHRPGQGWPQMSKPEGTKPGELTEGQRAYEARRAAKAGMSLEKWLAEKERRAKAEAAELSREAETAKPQAPEKKGWLSRLLDRAHQPLK